MKEFTKHFMGFIVLGFAGIAFISSVAAEGTGQQSNHSAKLQINRTQEWWKIASPNRTHKPIGQNVSLQAYIFYDWHNETKKNGRKKYPHKLPKVDPMKPYFDELFRQVQSYLHNQSIMVNITVKNVTMRNFSAASRPLSNINSTLNNLIKYGATLNQTQNTIFYYFTWSNNSVNSTTNKTRKVPGHPDAHQQTNGTFCTTNTSAAVIRHRNGSGTHWTTSIATLFVFGSKHFIYFTETDWKNMNKTFSKCRSRNTTTNATTPPAL
uniref:Putative 28 kDa metastriate family member n=1 Tax=Rhipicephalus pulchellus TaxID=72859 RepID=L7M8F3_RHIPC